MNLALPTCYKRDTSLGVVKNQSSIVLLKWIKSLFYPKNIMGKNSYLLILLLCLASQLNFSERVVACRVGSEKLKTFTRKSIEHLLDAELLESVYWPREPLDANILTKATGLNITLAETHYNLDGVLISGVGSSSNQQQQLQAKNEYIRPVLLRDIFVTCSTDRDRSYTLTINLELTNPFKSIDVRYQKQSLTLGGKQKKEWNDSSGLFRVRLPQSSFLVQLKQKIRYDECLEVNDVQLAPNVGYQVECMDNCSQEQQDYLEKIFIKKMTQLDAELDSMLSEKLLLGLQILLNQQRLDLDLYLN